MLIGTAIAPSEQRAINASINSGESLSSIATRSPRATPTDVTARAMRNVLARSSPYVSSRPW